MHSSISKTREPTHILATKKDLSEWLAHGNSKGQDVLKSEESEENESIKALYIVPSGYFNPIFSAVV
jgi:hypothetical protein